MGLLNVSPYVILQIVEAGLQVRDAVAFASTCRTLHELGQTRPFWMILARAASKLHPLPLPPFKVLDTCSVQELMQACRHHARVHHNLSRLPNPYLRRHRVLPAAAGQIYHFAFLPGGRYVIVLYRSGVFQCWDTSHVWPDSAHSGLETVGKKLAQFETGLRPMSWNFEMYAGRSEVMVVIVSFTDLGSSRLDALAMKWLNEDEVVVERLCQATTPFRTERIHIQGEIICATGRRSDSKCATVVFLDPRTQISVCVDTGLRESGFRFDSFPASPVSLMLYREEGQTVQTYCYPDVLDVLKQYGASVAHHVEQKRDRSPIPVVLLPPLVSQRYAFEKDCQLNGREEWFVTHPWNTPNFSRGDNAISIMTTSRAEGARPGAADAMVSFVPTYRTLTHHWFTPPSAEDLADPHLGIKPAIPLRRWTFHVADTIGVGVDHSEIICPGSNGTHLLWVWGNVTIHEGDPFDSDDDVEIDIRVEKRIHIATLPQDPECHPSRPGCPPETVVRDLLIDPNLIDLARIATTDIEDCHGILGLAMNPNDRRESFIHLLSY